MNDGEMAPGTSQNTKMINIIKNILFSLIKYLMSANNV